MLLSSNGGETLAGGFNPVLLRMGREKSKEFVTPGGRVSWVGPGKWLPPADTGLSEMLQEQSQPYTWQGNILLKRAYSWIFHHPGDASYLALRKLTYMWGIYPFWNGMSQPAMGNVRPSACRRRAPPRDPLPPVPPQAVDFLDAAGFRERRRLDQLGKSGASREPGDVGLIALAARATLGLRGDVVPRGRVGGRGHGIQVA